MHSNALLIESHAVRLLQVELESGISLTAQEFQYQILLEPITDYEVTMELLT